MGLKVGEVRKPRSYEGDTGGGAAASGERPASLGCVAPSTQSSWPHLP